MNRAAQPRAIDRWEYCSTAPGGSASSQRAAVRGLASRRVVVEAQFLRPHLDQLFTLQLVLASRAHPPLSLARLRAAVCGS